MNCKGFELAAVSLSGGSFRTTTAVGGPPAAAKRALHGREPDRLGVLAGERDRAHRRRQRSGRPPAARLAGRVGALRPGRKQRAVGRPARGRGEAPPAAAASASRPCSTASSRRAGCRPGEAPHHRRLAAVAVQRRPRPEPLRHRQHRAGRRGSGQRHRQLGGVAVDDARQRAALGVGQRRVERDRQRRRRGHRHHHRVRLELAVHQQPAAGGGHRSGRGRRRTPAAGEPLGQLRVSAGDPARLRSRANRWPTSRTASAAIRSAGCA